jgi:hypothetical protein
MRLAEQAFLNDELQEAANPMRLNEGAAPQESFQ